MFLDEKNIFISRWKNKGNFLNVGISCWWWRKDFVDIKICFR